jgi:hypothetical protein
VLFQVLDRVQDEVVEALRSAATDRHLARRELGAQPAAAPVASRPAA